MNWRDPETKIAVVALLLLAAYVAGMLLGLGKQ